MLTPATTWVPSNLVIPAGFMKIVLASNARPMFALAIAKLLAEVSYKAKPEANRLPPVSTNPANRMAKQRFL